ncbi:MAG: 7TM diverse intracellular signaling domain-containing protein [Pseudomonadota bacterium]
MALQVVAIIAVSSPLPAPGTEVSTLHIQTIHPGFFCLSPYVEILEDPSNTLTIEDVSSLAMSGNFKSFPGHNGNLGYKDSALWVRFTIALDESPEHVNSHGGWILENRWRFLSQFSLFVPDGQDHGHKVRWQRTEDGADHQWKAIGMSGLPLAVMLPGSAWPSTFYLCVKSWGTIVLDLRIRTYENFVSCQNTHRAWQYIFVGIITALILYNLLLSVSLRYPGLFYYIVWIFFMAMSMFRANGPPIPYFSQIPPEMDDRLIQLSAGIAHLFFIQFTRFFLNLKNTMPRLDRILAIAALFYFPVIIGTLVLKFPIIEFTLTTLSFAVAIITTLASFSLMLTGYAVARWFFMAFATIITCWIIYVLGYYELAPVNMTSAMLGIQAGSAMEAILLSMCMAQYIHGIQKQNELIKKRFQNLFDTISDYVFTHDLEGRILNANPAVCLGLGVKESEIIGHFFQEFMHPDYQKLFTGEYLPETITKGRRTGMMILKDFQGNRQYLEYRVTLARDENQTAIINGTGHLVTERILAQKEVRVLQSQLVHAQKMEAIGTLTSGISHDFNNLLQSIIAPLAIIRKRKLLSQEANRYLDIIDKASQRGAALVRQLMTFGRKRTGDFQIADLKEIVNETVAILKETLSKLITLTVKSPEKVHPILGDPGQIQQMLLNLSVNAKDAMPDGGSITFEILQSTGNTPGIPMGSMHGNPVILRVSDTGIGMSPETAEKIFEPFFTTKEKGKGTGLGLSMVYSIVQAHRGVITCDSAPDKGAIFTVYFPQAETDISREAETAYLPQHISGSGISVLIVEDEAYIRDIMKEMLLMYEFTVYEAIHGKEALDIFETHQKDINLVILDLNMPVMGGLECIRKIRATGSDVKIIITTGSFDLVDSKKLDDLNANNMMIKPYSPDEMLQKVKKTLFF